LKATASRWNNKPRVAKTIAFKQSCMAKNVGSTKEMFAILVWIRQEVTSIGET
jgi:hypothetical protein